MLRRARTGRKNPFTCPKIANRQTMQRSCAATAYRVECLDFRPLLFSGSFCSVPSDILGASSEPRASFIQATKTWPIDKVPCHGKARVDKRVDHHGQLWLPSYSGSAPFGPSCRRFSRFRSRVKPGNDPPSIANSKITAEEEPMGDENGVRNSALRQRAYRCAVGFATLGIVPSGKPENWAILLWRRKSQKRRVSAQVTF
jgi:hypothetical protein